MNFATHAVFGSKMGNARLAVIPNPFRGEGSAVRFLIPVAFSSCPAVIPQRFPARPKARRGGNLLLLFAFDFRGHALRRKT
jgi:hypothetical protein